LVRVGGRHSGQRWAALSRAVGLVRCDFIVFHPEFWNAPVVLPTVGVQIGKNGPSCIICIPLTLLISYSSVLLFPAMFLESFDRHGPWCPRLKVVSGPVYCLRTSLILGTITSGYLGERSTLGSCEDVSWPEPRLAGPNEQWRQPVRMCGQPGIPVPLPPFPTVLPVDSLISGQGGMCFPCVSC
jgi:hypothetical protein